MQSLSHLKPDVSIEQVPTKNRIWGDGPMADAARAHDWASTPLGPLELWSETLLANVNTLLSSPLPSILFWGDEMTQIYNDAFVPLLSEDRHRGGLGQSGRVFWLDAWPTVGHQLEGALYRGETTNSTNFLVPILRDGVLQDVWWDYAYLPVYMP